MKLTFKPSPNYRSPQSTNGIMYDLTLCLLVVTAFAVGYYGSNYGASYALRVIILMVSSVITACLVDAVWAKIQKQDIKTGILSSYSWITAMILTLMSQIDVSPYALCVATVIALVFGKLVFGGFGQNIFNPAAFGAAVIMSSFAATKSADFVTAATPTTTAAAYGWIMNTETFSSYITQYGGLGRMFLGWYPSSIGSTSALVIAMCCAFLIWRRDIDWRLPVVYIACVFLFTTVIGLIKGAGLWYGIFNVLAGGVMLGGVFMITDPVTNPLTIPGRIVFAVGCAALTVIIRLKANYPDGVLFSILLMNMMTPAIDKMFEGNQIKNASSYKKKTAITSALLALMAILVGCTIQGKTPEPASTPSAPAGALSGEDFSDNKTECTEVSNDGSTAVYACSADGFGLINGMGADYSRNEVTVTVDVKKGTVTDMKLDHFGDTAGIGDLATADDALAAYKGLSLKDSADVTTGATFTSRSVASMVKAALEAAAK